MDKGTNETTKAIITNKRLDGHRRDADGVARRAYTCDVECSGCGHAASVWFAGWSAMICGGCGAEMERQTPGKAPDPDTMTRGEIGLIVCADGFKMSVQASRTHYCLPCNSAGPWSHVESGFPSAREDLLLPYVDNAELEPTETVYGRVPAMVVREVVAKHGGLAGEAPAPEAAPEAEEVCPADDPEACDPDEEEIELLVPLVDRMKVPAEALEARRTRPGRRPGGVDGLVFNSTPDPGECVIYREGWAVGFAKRWDPMGREWAVFDLDGVQVGALGFDQTAEFRSPLDFLRFFEAPEAEEAVA